MKLAFNSAKNKNDKKEALLTDESAQYEENFIPHSDIGVSTESSLLVVPEFQQADLDALKADQSLLMLVPEMLARKHKFIPVSLNGNTLKIAMANPRDYDAINNIGVYTKMRLSILRADASLIEDKIREMYTTQRAYEAAKEISGSTDNDRVVAQEDNTQPIIRFVNNMIEQAVITKASDIHIEPEEKQLRIRFRVDGHLKNYMTTSAELAASVVSRIKFIAGLNIAERRTPQDGRITYTSNAQDIDLRISVLPCAFGEKIVIRITTALSFSLTKESIGFTPANIEKFDKILSLNHGIVLLTGPTGSGKTTTLYTAISEINREDINIVTVEDPVEMILPGINQVEINPRTGLTFATALRSILRQDPNVVMVGEIRDKETADIAMTLSITGHLVLSTLHTYDAPSAILRLVDMGVEPFMVSASIAAVVAQRLVRKICPFCKMEYTATDSEKILLGMQNEERVTLNRGYGCEKCGGTGYSGRTAVHEIMFMTPEIKEALAQGRSQDVIKKTAIEQGMESISENLKQMVLQGTTTVAEMFEAYSADL